jgi:hypothetical protein
MSDPMKWTKDGDHMTATQGGCEFIASKTYSFPSKVIPAQHRWTLEVYGPWYMCATFPRLRDCYAAADRVIKAMTILEASK